MNSITRSDSNSSNDALCTEARFHRIWSKWKRRIPALKKVEETYLRVPPRLRIAFITVWLLWKVCTLIFFLYLLFNMHLHLTGSGSDSVSSIGESTLSVDYEDSITTTRVLYIITTLSEFNNGLRRTIKGQDRLVEILIPVMVNGVESMIVPPFHYQVDVFLICAYELQPEREQLIRDSLPPNVGFQVWDDAVPLGYDNRNSKEKLIPNTRALARQHRYVIKDKFFHYDMFLAFEDDMVIKADHIDHFMAMSAELDRLRESAPMELPDVPETLDEPTKMKFFGEMTKGQLDRAVPGFIRVEVLLNDTVHSGQRKPLPIPPDFEFEDHAGGGGGERHIEPEICCHVNMPTSPRTPPSPPADDIIIWESNVKAFTLRELPPASNYVNWTVVMLGPGKKEKEEEKIGGYWSGRQGAFGDEKRPSGGPPDLIAQQGGWMATQTQIARMNDGLCMGSFLPPFDPPSYYGDGQESMNVEFWSGSYQFFTGVKSGCNMQRLMSIHPDHFSKHLIYHVANNKQRQLAQERMVRADNLFAQLNSVQKMAQAEKEKILLEHSQ
ncbi:unnamed protein product [Cylindrotheca closterium]|uniref:Uncharacterized protein n=1 Tax=Cylindrotheca closterium TaxID=2856 RepID=A0AAD2FQK1_9STRA|nr:unnamed protein product [Cylindrotheca closterium]